MEGGRLTRRGAAIIGVAFLVSTALGCVVGLIASAFIDRCIRAAR